MSLTTTKTYDFSHETDSFVIGLEGDEKWRFTKSTVDYEIKDGKLTITAPNSRFTRQKSRKKQNKAFIKPERDHRKKRRCLTCGHEFTAEKNIYICSPCKSTYAWHYAGSYELHAA